MKTLSNAQCLIAIDLSIAHPWLPWIRRPGPKPTERLSDPCQRSLLPEKRACAAMGAASSALIPEGPSTWHQMLGFSGAERARNPLRRLPVALLGLLSVLGALVWSCFTSSAGALLARQAIAPGHPASARVWQRPSEIPGNCF